MSSTVTSAGGTGNNLYLAAVSATGKNTGTLRIGDRVDIIALRGEDGRAVLEHVIAGPGDAACCPTQRVTSVFGMQDGRLAERSRPQRDPGGVELGKVEVDHVVGADHAGGDEAEGGHDDALGDTHQHWHPQDANSGGDLVPG